MMGPEAFEVVEPQAQIPKVSLIELIIREGELAYNPELPAEVRRSNEIEFKELFARTKTMALMPALTALLQPDRLKTWLRPHIIQALSILPLRPKGVRNTIEFILSVHPSNVQNAGTEQATAPESKGPSISLEALNSASKLISSPPSMMSAEAWFSGIASQLLSLLDGEGGLEMIKVASFIIGYGILGRRQLGAPGTSGWKAFAEPLISPINPTLSSKYSVSENLLPGRKSEIVSIKPSNVIVTKSQISNALRRLASILSSHPNPGLSKRLLDGLLLPLWSIFSWPVDNPQDFEEWRAPAGYLLQIILQLSSNSTPLLTVVDNLLFQGYQDDPRISWIYKQASGGGIQIELSATDESSPLAILDAKVVTFINLITTAKDGDAVPSLFLSLCKRWLSKAEPSARPRVIYAVDTTDESDKLEKRLIDAKILQKMMDVLPERLVGNSNQVLELANDVLQKVATTDPRPSDDDTGAIALSLINIVLTAQSFKKASQSQETYDSVRASLQTIAKKSRSENAITAQNLLLLLKFQAEESEETSSTPPDSAVEDRRTYNLALLYLTSTDSPPPVRAQGIGLITGLVDTNSPILDIPATLVLLLSLLQEEEEYIYLRVIKAIVLISTRHPRATARDLLDRYIDSNEELSINTRLRLGEALLQVLEHSRTSFSGDLAHHVSGGLLSIAGRRGYRPKTEAQQKKKAAVTKAKNREADEAWDGEVPQLEDVTADDELLNQIIEGWESRRGQEDIRIRASALSIFGAAIETNIAGMSSSMISSGIDISVNILALESEHEKAILRRAAILLVMSLLRALDKAQEEGTKLGFGFAGQSLEDVTRILKYVEGTDGDGLVRQHAKDVVESLENWQTKRLITSSQRYETELDGLAGLSVDPLKDEDGRPRPRIEEIE